MNENIDLTKILKDCPEGTKFYSTIFGEETYYKGFSSYQGDARPIFIYGKYGEGQYFCLSRNGHPYADNYGECCIFPSKEMRDWSKFTAPWYKKEKFDPMSLQTFDNILVKRYDNVWVATLLSHYKKIHVIESDISYLEFTTITNETYRHCIPYNNDTKYLVGTKCQAPECYRYWED